MDSSRMRTKNGVLSCRMKLPNNSSRATAIASSTSANMHDSLETPSSRRQDRIQGAIQSMAKLNSNMEALELPSDPDAQATVTDFLDFTEYLPSDMVRSLKLIRDLDETYTKAYDGVDGLTKTYGKLPQLPSDGKPSPVALRTDISQNLSEATRARTLAATEAYRMSNNVDRHYNRAKNILAKLQAMAEAYPPSREPSPAPQKVKSPVVSRAPKITLKVDGNRPGEESSRRVRTHRAPRITVPGEVLAPYEVDYESYSSHSESGESEEDEPVTPRQTPGRTLAPKTNGRNTLKLKVPKPKSSSPKAVRPPRPPGAMGTNVHSTVAGISTSNALLKLKPPPAGAEPGSEDAPWLQLTDWELGMLRKRMKKNAVWSPSDTMISRELKLLSRGIEFYRVAKRTAEESGVPMAYPVPPQLLGIKVDAEGALSVEAVKKDQEIPGVEPPQGKPSMKPTEAKKPSAARNRSSKKAIRALELAKAAEEVEESNRKLSEVSKAMSSLFGSQVDSSKKTPSRAPVRASAKKRKRPTANVDSDVAEKPIEGEMAPKIEPTEKPQVKRNKTETPIPAPQPLSTRSTKQTTPASVVEASVAESAPSVAPSVTSETPIPVPGGPRRRTPAPILPAPKATAQAAPKKAPEPVVSTRSSRSSAVIKTPTPAPEPLPVKRPPSSRGKASPAVTPSAANFPTGSATIDRPRRISTARNTPAPPPPVLEPRQPSRRAKKPAPGVVTANDDGSTTVSVGNRKGATRRKTAPRKDYKEGSISGGTSSAAAAAAAAAAETVEEYDDEGNLIPADEPRYCLCNRVSFGTMIACENGNCEKEWFHLECVGLTQVPKRTRQWYCPDCRKGRNVDPNGELIPKGRKKRV